MVNLYGEINRVGPRSGHALPRARMPVPYYNFAPSLRFFVKLGMLYTYFDVSDSIYPVADQNKPTSGWEFLS